MKKTLHKIFKLYSNLIMNLNGMFIFVGILAVVFGDYGWFPNKDIYTISRFVYQCVIPIMIAYSLGNHVKREKDENTIDLHREGGVIAVMATAGLIAADQGSELFGAMILGPICGSVWENLLLPQLKRAKNGAEMLLRNVVVAIAGMVFAVLSLYVITPLASDIVRLVFKGTGYLIDRNLIFLLSILIEPGKVFFLNNIMNHGILVPLGLQQISQSGSSVLFLLECNPGPGLGVLLALYLVNYKKRKQYAASMFTQFIGGVHEVYFPEVLASPWLISALIGGGVAGTLCFSTMGVATVAPISPGSILTMVMVTEHTCVLEMLLGVLVSTLVSFLIGVAILWWRREKQGECKVMNDAAISPEPSEQQPVASEREGIVKPIRKIGVICDGGVGSSAMGAALLRRKLTESNIMDVEVRAYAGDLVPADLDVGICQKHFKMMTGFELHGAPLYEVENLMDSGEYETVIEEIKKRNGEKV